MFKKFGLCPASLPGGHPDAFSCLYPIVAKAGWLQRQGIKGEDVIFYFEPLITKDLESSGFPGG
jgi:hypothetical protein